MSYSSLMSDYTPHPSHNGGQTAGEFDKKKYIYSLSDEKEDREVETPQRGCNFNLLTVAHVTFQ